MIIINNLIKNNNNNNNKDSEQYAIAHHSECQYPVCTNLAIILPNINWQGIVYTVFSTQSFYTLAFTDRYKEQFFS